MSAIATAFFGLMSVLLYAWNMSQAFGSVSGASVDPAQKARLLSEGIAHAMRVSLAAGSFCALSMLALVSYTVIYFAAKQRQEREAHDDLMRRLS